MLSLSIANPRQKERPTLLPAGVLLLVAGTLIGLSFPLAKLAAAAGVHPVVWVGLISFSSALALLPVAFRDASFRQLGPRKLRYALIAGPLTFAGPNLLVFAVIPHTGAGYSGLMFALSPVFTLMVSALFRLQLPTKWGLVGIIFGLAGAATVSLSRVTAESSPSYAMLGLSAAIPLALALGNVYRSVDWPRDAAPDELAFLSHLFAGVLYALLIPFVTDWAGLALLLTVLPLVLAQVAVAAATAPVVFRLQQRGGPVMLSQMGYVAAGVSLAVGSLWMGEQYPLGTWLGATVIAGGIGLTLFASRLPRTETA
ncbi:DMT family transporter [Motiliproteus sediminis]|uniref:DMT family transporter n=1 Tax=Motiliproteus sediminis TaxID=1468178 RepID=UPI001AF01A03|nr:DMT family transporter [Motiliproteus sediminis]